MESLGELLIALVGIFVWSVATIFLIWLIGLFVVNTINLICGTCFIWNLAYSILIYAILIILFVVFFKNYKNYWR